MNRRVLLGAVLATLPLLAAMGFATSPPSCAAGYRTSAAALLGDEPPPIDKVFMMSALNSTGEWEEFGAIITLQGTETWLGLELPFGENQSPSAIGMMDPKIGKRELVAWTNPGPDTDINASKWVRGFMIPNAGRGPESGVWWLKPVDQTPPWNGKAWSGTYQEVAFPGGPCA